MYIYFNRRPLYVPLLIPDRVRPLPNGNSFQHNVNFRTDGFTRRQLKKIIRTAMQRNLSFVPFVPFVLKKKSVRRVVLERNHQGDEQCLAGIVKLEHI